LRPACHGYNHSYIREAVERQLALMPPGALQVIQQQPYGSVLLGLTPVGLLAFGIYGLAEAIFRRISAPSLHRAGAKSGVARR